MTVKIGTPVFLLGLLKKKSKYRFPYISEVFKVATSLNELNSKIKYKLALSTIKITILLGASFLVGKMFYSLHKNLIDKIIQ